MMIRPCFYLSSDEKPVAEESIVYRECIPFLRVPLLSLKLSKSSEDALTRVYDFSTSVEIGADSIRVTFQAHLLLSYGSIL